MCADVPAMRAMAGSNSQRSGYIISAMPTTTAVSIIT